MNIKRCFTNNRGDTTINAVFLILVMNMLIAFLLLFVTVQIQCTEIRNHAKISLNNLSAIIAEDTYRAMREGNMEEYEKICSASPEYQAHLKATFDTNLLEHLRLETEDYRITSNRLEIRQTGERIEFSFVCTGRFRLSMFGREYEPVTRDVTLTGYHNTKY